MTAHVLAFTGSKKPRRETKADLAARIVPKVLGVLANGQIGRHGESNPRDRKQAIFEI